VDSWEDPVDFETMFSVVGERVLDFGFKFVANKLLDLQLEIFLANIYKYLLDILVFSNQPRELFLVMIMICVFDIVARNIGGMLACICRRLLVFFNCLHF
jgi:hypothetical protein